ncbi:MAG TPA: hypothetical protein VJ723_08655 [Candidatus Angelobacter sp.]|nr:hypothetical protein [Candidatus Angelobacter sp.]
MIRSINRQNYKRARQLCLGFLFLVSGSQCQFVEAQTQPASAMRVDDVKLSPQWVSHETTALAALKQASECVKTTLATPKTDCNPTALLKKAADEYSQMAALLPGRTGHLEEAVEVANGLLRSGAPVQTIEFLMTRPETLAEPLLAHLLADALFAIGDYENAALAYRAWISAGCGGYLYSMQSNAVWIVPKTGDRCSHLPEVMRSRLEMLQDTTRGEPSNLPEHNYPTGNFVAH